MAAKGYTVLVEVDENWVWFDCWLKLCASELFDLIVVAGRLLPVLSRRNKKSPRLCLRERKNEITLGLIVTRSNLDQII